MWFYIVAIPHEIQTRIRILHIIGRCQFCALPANIDMAACEIDGSPRNNAASLEVPEHITTTNATTSPEKDHVHFLYEISSGSSSDRLAASDFPVEVEATTRAALSVVATPCASFTKERSTHMVYPHSQNPYQAEPWQPFTSFLSQARRSKERRWEVSSRHRMS